MRILLSVLMMCFTTLPVFAGDKMKDIWPDTLMNWLKIMEVPKNRLLSAVDSDGYFLGVWINENGQVRVADFCYGKSDRVRSSTIEIVDMSDKQNLVDEDFELLLEDDVEVVNNGTSHVGPIRFESSTTTIFLRGQYFELKNAEGRDFVVKLIDTSVPNKPKCYAEVKVILPKRMPK